MSRDIDSERKLFLVPKERRRGIQPYEEAYASAARDALRRYVEDVGSQKEAERTIGLDQGQISKALAPGSTIQLQLSTLIALRLKTNTSIDNLLNLPKIRTQSQASLSELRARYDEIVREIDLRLRPDEASKKRGENG